MKLGVIIPTYDNLEMLKPLVKQLKGFNVYVIEDGQKQETIKWLKKQKVKSIFHEENEGVSHSWNDGTKAAEKDKCTHFAIINDDIRLPKNWWEDCRKEFKDDIHLVCLKTEVLNISGWFFIIDKYCLDEIGYFYSSSKYGNEDMNYLERYINKGLKVSKVDIDVYHYGSKTIKKLMEQNV